jgi:glycosyltransferase involved in cell wall biosynthesis
MTMPKVSVVMSVYNGEKYLREAVDSVLGQTFRGFEFIIVDDGSTDRTWAVLQSYDDPRIVPLRNEENIGLTQSLNKALAVASGEYIARMDADDVSLPERLEKQVAYLDAHPEVGLLGTWVEIMGERGERLSVLRRPMDPPFIKWSLLFDNYLFHSTVMYRRSLVEKLGGYNTSRYAQDYDLWSRMSFETQIAKLPEALVRWRRHTAGITAQKLARQEALAAEISAGNIRRLLSRDSVSTQAVENMRTLWLGRNEPIRGQSLEQVATDFKQLLSFFCERYSSSDAVSDVDGQSLSRGLGKLKRQALSRMYFQLAVQYYRSGDMSNTWPYLLRAFVRRPARVTATVAGRIVLRTRIKERASGLLKQTKQALFGGNRAG